jgi:CheY-like chemotaxis protein
MDTVLVVTPDGTERAAMLAALGSAQVDMSSASDYVSGIARLEIATPDLLITVVRRDGFNGLSLVEAGSARKPRMAAVVVHDSPEMARQCAAMPSTCAIVRHIDRANSATELVRVVAEALTLRERRRWSRTMLQVPWVVSLLSGRARVLDVSYGGIQLEVNSRHEWSLPALFQIVLPTMGSLNAQRVWSRPAGASGMVSCGAEVDPVSLRRILRWRRMVDALRKAGNTVLL